jgi:hypothetical protein
MPSVAAIAQRALSRLLRKLAGLARCGEFRRLTVEGLGDTFSGVYLHI